jgi:hypothetical protein
MLLSSGRQLTSPDRNARPAQKKSHRIFFSVWEKREKSKGPCMTTMIARLLLPSLYLVFLFITITEAFVLKSRRLLQISNGDCHQDSHFDRQCGLCPTCLSRKRSDIGAVSILENCSRRVSHTNRQILVYWTIIIKSQKSGHCLPKVSRFLALRTRASVCRMVDNASRKGAIGRCQLVCRLRFLGALFPNASSQHPHPKTFEESTPSIPIAPRSIPLPR